MRRRPGISGLQKDADARNHFRKVGENVAKVRTDLMKEQLATFRSQLEDFARKHKTTTRQVYREEVESIMHMSKKESNYVYSFLSKMQNDIRKNPAFRSQFHEMCAKVGVDPLASNKGFWAELLGIGDFYYELGVQIVDICLATRSANGGLIDLQELCTHLCQKRKVARDSVTEDDCLRAIDKLKGLGSGFEVFKFGKKRLVRSVPTELNKDHNELLDIAQIHGYVTVDDVQKRLGWSHGRALDGLETLLKEGLSMIDDGHRDGKRRYWFPCVALISTPAAGDEGAKSLS